MEKEKLLIVDHEDVFALCDAVDFKKYRAINFFENYEFSFEEGQSLRPNSFCNRRYPTPADLNEVVFKNCHFKSYVKVTTSNRNVTFEGCDFFEDVSLQNSRFTGKVRFRGCRFHKKTNFRNTKFEGLVDFWRTHFFQETIFYKTDFLKVAVFSAAIFEKNVLFTYSLINHLILFRGTVFRKGLDLSLAIIPGQIGAFDLRVSDFKSLKRKLNDDEFEDAVSKNGDIPIKNKRETLRLFKEQYEKTSNTVESIPFKVLEKKTLLVEQRINLYRLRKKDIKGKKEPWFRFLIEKWKSIFNIGILRLNWMSNYYGAAYVQGVLFTLLVGALFFYLSLLGTSKYEFAWNFDPNIVRSEIANYAYFLLPIHRFDYLGQEFCEKFELYNGFYLFDLLGRVFIGYGIYQTAQAFRKFK
ncbi:pentapeptide repeat-containing protein [Roseivirga echinicomitans]|uniref:Pentapeptide repeat-containing protein n=1 Tax=Roseivirga echinicomitans TaxID=296218 RepID=A0A150XEM8_9BACT|nr:pentapeptide repeat-containing protein [Roseivirga echinicomitans]KYG77163.1 hypothetical protein AWN68_18190 [Roseivirga echinicomitans]